MNLRADIYVLGWLLVLLGLFQEVPGLAALWYGEPVAPHLTCASISLLTGLGLVRGARVSDWRLRPRDGFFVVGMGWVVVSAFGAMPYGATGTLGPVDAFFEAVSGFTTTGSTVLSGLDSMPRSLLLWRAFTQWVGGMGIILFTIAVLPLLGIGGMQLFKAEVPGPIADKIRPRLADTARRLWLIYVGLTAAQIIALYAVGLPLFDALCHAFTTLPTGGFSTHDLSVGGFRSAAVEWIIIAFMLLAGMNFVLHYRLLSGRFREVVADAELWYFLLTVAGATAVVAMRLIADGWSLARGVREAAFQVVSIVTTTGYVTADFERWAPFTHVVLLVLMVLGAMSGSTGGGVKSLRALVGLRSLRVAFERLVHPRAVRTVKYGGRPVPEEVVAGIWAFFTAYFLIACLATLVVTAAGYDLVTAFSAALTALGNVGPGLGEVGAMDNFAHFPAAVKLVLAFCMLAGRLEIFTLLVLVVPGFWRR